MWVAGEEARVKKDLGALLQAVRDGRMELNAFFVQTREVWLRMAKHLMRRWQPPSWYEAEELAADIQLEAWRFIWKYDQDQAKGKSLLWYVEWNAMDKGKKRLHKVRGANLHRDPDNQKTERREYLYSGWNSVEEGAGRRDWAESQPGKWPAPDDEAADREAVARAIAACDTEVERQVIQILAECRDLRSTATRVLAVRGGTQRQACALVARTAYKVGARVAREAA
jgi:hypothetical protein